MTDEEAAGRLRAILAGVDDGGAMARLGYRVSAQELFVQATAVRMKSRPMREWDEDAIRRLAVRMCRDYPPLMGTGAEDAFVLPGGMHLSKRSWADGTRLVLSDFSASSRVMRPSMDVDGVVRIVDLDERQRAGMRAIVDDVAARVLAALRPILGDRIPADAIVSSTRPSDWQWRWALTLRDGAVISDVARNGEVVHDRAAHVVPRMERKARDYLACEERMSGTKRRIAQVQAHCDAAIADADLPIGFRVVPSPDDAGTRMWVVADAYGATGLPECRHVGSASFEGDSEYRHMPPLTHFVDEQRRLHRRYGPTPGSHAGRQWLIDAPTAWWLAATGRGSRIARDVADGLPYDGGDTGVRLRVVDGRMFGTCAIAPGIEWKGDRLELRSTEISQTVATALKGRSVRQVVEHASLTTEDVISRAVHRVSKKGKALIVHVRPRMIPIERIDALAN
jgi:hypothetical protein